MTSKNSREKKLEKLRVKEGPGSHTVLHADQAFLEGLQKKIDELRDVLKSDVNVNLDDLLEQLSTIRSIAPAVEKLQQSIKSIEFPDVPENIRLVGLQPLFEAIERHVQHIQELKSFKLPDAKVEIVDNQKISEITDRLDSLVKVVRDNSVQSQAPEDYMPIRRVIKIGNKFLFDDSIMTGGGGGGSGGSLLITGQSSGIAESTSSIYDGSQELTPKFKAISTGSNGDNIIVDAVSGKKIRVLSYMFISSGIVTAIWQSGSTDISGPLPLVASTGVSAGYNSKGHFETSVGAALQINQNSTATLGGHLTYVEIDG